MPRRMTPQSDESVALVEEMHSFFAGYKEWVRARLPEGETSPARLLVLVSLKRWGQVTMGTLAARLARPKSNLTLLIDELEGEGLVVRRAHPTDRRATYVELTAAGRRMATESGARYDREIARLFDTLPSGERAQLLDTVRRLTAFLRENAKDGEPDERRSRRAAAHRAPAAGHRTAPSPRRGDTARAGR